MQRVTFLRKLRYPLVITIHAGLIVLSYYAAFLLRFDFRMQGYLSLISQTLPMLIIIKLIIFYYFGLFHSSLRYASMFDLWQILKANAVATVGFFFAVVFIKAGLGVPRSVFILDWGICLGLTGGIRYISRFFREFYSIRFPMTGHKSLINERRSSMNRVPK